jgi:hypothetical protein
LFLLSLHTLPSLFPSGHLPVNFAQAWARRSRLVALSEH